MWRPRLGVIVLELGFWFGDAGSGMARIVEGAGNYFVLLDF
jgi:hypothetical protein